MIRFMLVRRFVSSPRPDLEQSGFFVQSRRIGRHKRVWSFEQGLHLPTVFFFQLPNSLFLHVLQKLDQIFFGDDCESLPMIASSIDDLNSQWIRRTVEYLYYVPSVDGQMSGSLNDRTIPIDDLKTRTLQVVFQCKRAVSFDFGRAHGELMNLPPSRLIGRHTGVRR
ncbi:hypothetical protein BKA80DRAFT_284441 [Phyllosticta citrichinensis]